jgi:hypothetical protein
MKNIEWRFGEGKIEKSTIKAFETKTGFSFPAPYLALVLKSNGATPSAKVFNVQDGTEHVFNYLLDWDEKQKGNIISTYRSFSTEHVKTVVPFANDPFGNLICFNFADSELEPSIVFWNHELDAFVPVSNQFEKFIDSLAIQ